jgi:phage repressor protein C with HTH and peptisase S24 domain
MNKYEIRRLALIKLVSKVGGQAKLADALEINPSYISRMLYEDGKAGKKRIGEDMVEKLDKLFFGWSNNFENNNKIFEKDEYSINQYHDVRGAMGNGLVLRGESGQITSWKVNQEWINKNVPSNTGSKNLAIVTGFGDSMRGMFNSGDPLLIDTGVKSLDYDGVYFFRVGDEGFIKRLQRIPGEGIRVISKNTEYETWTINENMDFEVFGRVLKVWRSEEF